MKTVTIHAPHDLRIDEHADAVPGEGQVEVAIDTGGICGSDLHYYHQGGFGTVRLREPMILGHEVAGYVRSIGAGVTGVKVGDLVALNPSRPCGHCEYCQAGLQNHCINMLFYGSAMRFPHVQGAFRERIVAEASQCFAVPGGVSPAAAAVAEPFAVALHAVARAGSLIGRRVLVTGCGPIGALVVMAAHLHGAREIVATDVVDEALARVRDLGADRTINVARDTGALAGYASGKGTFDTLFEASGNPAAFLDGIAALKPRGVMVQIGLGSSVNLPFNLITAREVEVRGSFRFNDEFRLAVDLIGSGRADVGPLITHKFGLNEAVKAFETASDRTRAMKVQLSFS